MTLTALTIQNFKGIKNHVCISFKPLTLLFGPNSSGKSTIIQALHYAREIFERENLDPGRTIIGGESVDLGGFTNLVHNHDITSPITLRFDLDLTDTEIPEYLQTEEVDSSSELTPIWYVTSQIKTAWVQVSIKWSLLQNKPMVESYEIGANNDPLARITASEDGRQISLSFLNSQHPAFLDDEIDEPMDESEPGNILIFLAENTLKEVTLIKGNTVDLGILGQISALPRWGRPIEFQEELWKQINTKEKANYQYREQFIGLLSALIVGPGEMVRDALRKLHYLGPLREVPPRNYETPRTSDKSRWATGIGAWDVLHNADSHFLDKVNDWLAGENRLKSGYRVEIKRFKELDINSPIMLILNQERALDEEEWIKEELDNLPVKARLFLREEANGIELLAQDIGIGISQVIPVIVISLNSLDGIVAIEQPELHIHPAFQVVLGDLFISQAKDTNVSFILETHSEHLLLRLLRRIRETSEDRLPPGIEGLTPDNLAIYFIETKDDGEVQMSELKVDKSGDSSGRWPDGFFEERNEEFY